MAKKPKSSKQPVDNLTKSSKKKDVELKEDELGRATGGAYDAFIKGEIKF